MIGFISAISSALAVIILVVISSLLAFVQAMMPATGIVRLSDVKYRYVMESSYINPELIREVIIQSENIGIGDRVISYQNGCNYGFNANERQMLEISTFNYISLAQYFDGTVPIESMYLFEEKEVLNSCFIDINLSPFSSKPTENNDG